VHKLAKSHPCPFEVADQRPAYLRDEGLDDSVVLVAPEEPEVPPPPAPPTSALSKRLSRLGLSPTRTASSGSVIPKGQVTARLAATLLDNRGPVRGMLVVADSGVLFEPFRSEPWTQVYGAAAFRCIVPRSAVVRCVPPPANGAVAARQAKYNIRWLCGGGTADQVQDSARGADRRGRLHCGARNAGT